MFVTLTTSPGIEVSFFSSTSSIKTAFFIKLFLAGLLKAFSKLSDDEIALEIEDAVIPC